MPISAEQILNLDLMAYALVFARVAAMVATLPAFGETMAPARVRLTLALALTFVLTPLVPANALKADAGPLAVAGALALETLTGLAIGFVARFLMSAVQVAGSVIALQMGLSFAMSVDPSQGSQGAILGTFLNLLALTLIFATDTHHLLIGAIEHSFTQFPAGQWGQTGDWAKLATGFVSKSFALGIQLAMPFIVFGVVLQLASGMVARLMPQMQIFFMTVPISLLGGFVLLMVCLSTIMFTFLTVFQAEMAPLSGLKP